MIFDDLQWFVANLACSHLHIFMQKFANLNLSMNTSYFFYPVCLSNALSEAEHPNNMTSSVIKHNHHNLNKVTL